MTVATRSMDDSLFGFVRSITGYCLQLQRRQMFEQAARIFWIACSTVVSKSTYGDDGYLQKVFGQLSDSLQQDYDQAQQSHTSLEAENWLIYALLNKVCFLSILWKMMNAALDYTPDGPPEELLHDIKELLRETEQPLQAIFESLPDSRPRGRHVIFCEGLRASLEQLDRTADNTPAAGAFTNVKVRKSMSPDGNANALH